MSRATRHTRAWYGARVYDWRPAPFGRIRKAPPSEARRWTARAPRRLARPLAGWRDLAPQLAAWDAEGLTVPEQAARLGIRQPQLAGIRARLIREGRLTARGRRGRAWSAADTDRLIDLVEQGYGYDALAKRLGRTRAAVVIKCKRLRIRPLTTLSTLSAHDAARVLGVPCSKKIAWWIAEGWLAARNAGTAARPLWRLTWDDLTAFLERRDCWLSWDPARITDAALREWAQELRAGEPRYLTQGEVAARFHVTVSTVGQWIDKGWLPAHRVGRGNRVVAETDLAGWTVPSARERPRKRSGTAACGVPGCRRTYCYDGYCLDCRRGAHAAGVPVAELAAPAPRRRR
jgi:excisionase family DNA binding protein